MIRFVNLRNLIFKRPLKIFKKEFDSFKEDFEMFKRDAFWLEEWSAYSLFKRFLQWGSMV